VSEFTGERVIPGAVNDDLWAEHIARYAFARRFATGGKTLDIGCGTGYGIAELAGASEFAVGIDIAQEAVAYARTNYPLPNAAFLRASASTLPFRPGSFRLITAFEVIEHLDDWAALISEARRVLHPDGVFLVSTPNRLYYTDSRGEEGPNPFHVHEFAFSEFRDALAGSFPHVTMLQQNRTEAFAFSPAQPIPAPADARVDGSRGTADDAHFFIAVCGINCNPELRSFVYLRKVSNLLREREQHIQMLEADLAKLKHEHQVLVDVHQRQTEELEEHNRWADKLEKDWRAALDRVAQLQEELKAEQAAGRKTADAYAAKVAELEEDARQKAQWALDTEARLSAELAAKCDELAEAVRLLDRAEATIVERTAWAQDLKGKLDGLEARMRMIRESRWIRMGRVVGVGPRVQD